MYHYPARPPRLKGFDYSAKRTYFVTICTKDRLCHFSDRKIALIATNVIMRYREAGRYYLYAYCVMPDHVHLLLKLRAGNGPLPLVVGILKAGIRHAAAPRSGVVWMRGFYERIKREHGDALELVEYILLNPVRAGLVSEAAAYPFAGSRDPWC